MAEAEKRMHRCCFAGHRPEKLMTDEQAVKQWLSEQIDLAIGRSFTTFITGMAMGVDLWAAQLVICRREAGQPIHLIAASPYPTFCFRWSESWRKQYEAVWAAADHRVLISREYADDAFRRRNEWMIDHSALVIAFHSGAPGSTRDLLAYAQQRGVETVAAEG